jgi:Mg-chelatase subunit ChlD
MWRTVAIALIPILFSACAMGQSSQQEIRAIVLVIDKSGSMRDQNRMYYAKEAAKSIGRQMSDADRLGIIAFDLKPFVVLYTEQVGRLRPQDLISKQIERLKPGGQTYFLPALAEAKRQLELAGPGRKTYCTLERWCNPRYAR